MNSSSKEVDIFGDMMTTARVRRNFPSKFCFIFVFPLSISCVFTTSSVDKTEKSKNKLKEKSKVPRHEDEQAHSTPQPDKKTTTNNNNIQNTPTSHSTPVRPTQPKSKPTTASTNTEGIFVASK